MTDVSVKKCLKAQYGLLYVCRQRHQQFFFLWVQVNLPFPSIEMPQIQLESPWNCCKLSSEVQKRAPATNGVKCIFTRGFLDYKASVKWKNITGNTLRASSSGSAKPTSPNLCLDNCTPCSHKLVRICLHVPPQTCIRFDFAIAMYKLAHSIHVNLQHWKITALDGTSGFTLYIWSIIWQNKHRLF